MKVFSLLAYYRRLANTSGRRSAVLWLTRNCIAKPKRNPILVLGNQKSGTSVVAALLAKATGTAVSIDLKMQVACPLYDLLESGSLSFERFVRINSYSFSKKIVKEPELTFHYKQLTQHFPESPVVFVHRDPAENLRSIYERLGFPGDVATMECRHLNHLPQAWRMIIGAEGSPQDTVIPVLKNLCDRWRRAADAEISGESSAICLAYETFKQDKEGVIRALAERLSIPAPHAIKDALDVKYQPASPSGLPAEDFFSAANLEIIKDATRAYAKRLGYA